MAKPLLANSLSSITQLAGNPPRFPRNPTEQKRESLVLYIARIPGSRDVILTTMKPRLKNVTAEDVLNCLYYFHVDMPSDVFLMGDMQVREATESVHEQLCTPIARKPLPEGSAVEVMKEHPQMPESGWQTETTLSRAPSGALRFQKVFKALPPQHILAEVLDQKPSLPQRPGPDLSNVPARRPLGPRPYLSQPEANKSLLPGRENMPFGSGTTEKASEPDTVRNNLDDQARCRNELTNNQVSRDSTPFSNSGESWGRQALSITVIRRDPTSGAQWNVGKIGDQSAVDARALFSIPGSVQHRSSSTIQVQLTTPGYRQFRSPLMTQNLGRGMHEIHAPKYRDTQFSFDRLVRMVWSKSWERKYKQHGRSSSDQTSALNTAYLRSNLDLAPRQGMGENFNSIIDMPKHAIYGSGFLSPWNGRCEFSTSTSGRSLTCKHTMDNPPTVSSPTGSVTGVSAEISELRFNLPSSHVATASTNRTPDGRPVSSYNPSHPSKDSNVIPPPPPTSYAALYPSDDDDGEGKRGNALDLSLGREMAGGGIRGKRVKLGKLIVHDEGLKMLDLVIAANMGIWWTVWER